MLISIIIPVYNGEKFIKECIDSALNQTYKDIEVIVVNDGSTDSTEKLLYDTYHDDPRCEKPRVLVYNKKQNGGTASALNVGIREAKGDFIKWLSADDVLLPDAIEKMVKFVMDPFWKNVREDWIFYTDYHVIDENSKHLRDFIEPYRPTSDLWKFFFGNASTSLIHKKVFEKCGSFNESLAHSEDYEFWLRATQLFGVEMHRIPIFTLNYRKHPEQLTNSVGGQLDNFIKEKIHNEQSKITAR